MTPELAPRTRTWLYVGALVTNVGTAAGFALAALFGLLDPETAAAAAGIITGAIGTLSTGLAIGYRPTIADE